MTSIWGEQGVKPKRAARSGQRKRNVSMVHSIPSVAAANPEDVYLSLAVKKRTVSGYQGLLAVVGVAVLAGVVWHYVKEGNVEADRVYEEAKANPKRVVFAEAEEDVALRAAIQFRDFGYGTPILVGRTAGVRKKLEELQVDDIDSFEIQNSADSDHVPVADRGMGVTDDLLYVAW